MLDRLRKDRRVAVSMMASPSAIRPATWAVKTGVPSETGDASAAGAALRLLGWAAAVVGAGLASGNGLIAGNRPAALPAPMSMLASPLRAGMCPSGSTARFGAAGEALTDFAGAAAVTAVVIAAAGLFHVVVVTTLAVAVSFTEVTEVAFDATVIRAFRLAGCFVVTELRLHDAVPSPLAHPLLNVGFWLDGCAVSATDTSEADPFWVVTCTTKVAVWPRLMLDWERWTCTHSSGAAVVLALAPLLVLVLALLVLVLALLLPRGLALLLLLALALLLPRGLALPLLLPAPLLLLGLALLLGLVAVWASSVAAVAPLAADVPDLGGEGDADREGDGEAGREGDGDAGREGDGEADREGDGEADREGDGEAELSGLRVTSDEGDTTVDGPLVAGDGVAGGLVAGEGDGACEGEGEGDGEGVGVAEEGSAWHTVSVFAVVASGAACALPSRPRVRKLPLSKVTAATLACAKRIRIACLRCSSGLPCALRDSEATRGRMGMGTHFRCQATYASPVLRITDGPVRRTVDGLVCPRHEPSDGLRVGSVP